MDAARRGYSHIAVQPIGHEQTNDPQMEVRAALAFHAGRVRSTSVMTGIHRDNYFYSVVRERFGRACNRSCLLPCGSDRTRLTARRVTLRGYSSPLWFRAGTRCVDIGRVSYSSPKLLFGGCMYEVSGDGQMVIQFRAQ